MELRLSWTNPPTWWRHYVETYTHYRPSVRWSLLNEHSSCGWLKTPWRWRDVTEMMSQSPQTVLRHLLQCELHGKHKIRNVIYRQSPLHWRHNDHDSVSNHQPHGCLLNRLFRRRSKKTSKLRVTGLCVGNSPGPVNSPHKGPVTRKMFPFDDVIMTMTKSTLQKSHTLDRSVVLPIYIAAQKNSPI